MTAYDVAVIGLGAMGSAALFHLARRGKRVLGIEQFEPGHDRGSSHGESRAIRLGYFEHPSYVPLARPAYENWRELERLAGEKVLTVTGVLEIGKPGSVIVEGSLAASSLHGLEHKVLDASGIAKRYPQFTLPNDYSAVWQPEGGFLQPELANALHLRLARAAGAEVLVNTPVLGVEPTSSGVRIVLEGSVVEAASAVIAAGPWIAGLAPELKPHLTLSRQVLCWFAPRDPDAVRLGKLPVFIIDGEHDIAYGFPDFSGSGFKCASHHGSGIWARADEARQDAGPADERRMHDFLETYLPAAAGPLKNMRTCIYTKTPDEDFVIDLSPSDPRIVVASPCSGHGYKFASVIGEILADLAIEGETRHDISRFAIGRFAGGTPATNRWLPRSLSMDKVRKKGRGSRAGELRVGTSGWHYADWWGPFYPEEVRKKDALSYYASRFCATELNAPFYRTPTPKAVQGWFDATPDDFRFAWKASRFLTHFKKLLVEDKSLKLLYDRVDLLRHKAGPVLFQLPPQMAADRERLATFLKRLKRSRRYCFEFRHASWYDASIFDLLRDHNVSLCLSDHASAPAPLEVTADWVYVRNHGSSGRYHGSYSDAALKGWAKHIRKWRKEGRDVWCFFDNDVKSAAPSDAEKLLALLGGR